MLSSCRNWPAQHTPIPPRIKGLDQLPSAERTVTVAGRQSRDRPRDGAFLVRFPLE
jgi:hypothetical protein